MDSWADYAADRPAATELQSRLGLMVVQRQGMASGSSPSTSRKPRSDDPKESALTVNEAPDKGQLSASASDAETPTLVFLHGTTGEGQIHFGHLAERFDDRRHVVLPDCAGSGNSRLADEPFTLDLIVDEVAGIVDASSAAPVDLVGFSLGAVVAAAVAAVHPDSVERLVLIAGWVSSDDARHQLVFDT